MKVEELTGAQLDYWVAKAEGICLHDAPHTKECGNWGTDYTCTRCGKDASSRPNVGNWHPSTDWAQGGPIIEREVIDLSFSPEYGYVTASIFVHGPGPADVELAGQAEGYSPLVAAMRAYVASKFGETVQDDPASQPVHADLLAAAQYEDAYGAGHLDGAQ